MQNHDTMKPVKQTKSESEVTYNTNVILWIYLGLLYMLFNTRITQL